MARTAVQNIKRRGAVYWWRRKISLARLGFFSNRPISCEFSLLTKELDSARGRAAAMTAYSESLRMSFRDNVARHGLDEQTISTIFVEEVRSYRNELVHLEAAWKAHPFWSSLSNRDDDLAIFQALWEGIADQGLGVPRDWNFVEKHFAQFDTEMQSNIRALLRNHNDLPESLRLSAQQRLAQAGATSNAVSIPVAVDVIAKARAEASRRVRENSDFDDLAKFASLATSFAHAIAPASQTFSTTPDTGTKPRLPDASLDEEQGRLAAMTPTEFAEVFIGERFSGLEHRTGNKRKKAIVQDSTLRDIRWIALLVEKSLPPGMPFANVTPDDVKSLDGWFGRLPVTIGKSPKDRDPSTTFEMIEECALARLDEGVLDPDQIGLSVNTSNKHWQNFARLHEYLRSRVPSVEPVPVSVYITAEDKAAHEGRAKYTVEQGVAIFNLPPWTGCVGLADRLEAGREIIHDALFFVLLLVWYTGARREEICKLRLDDIQRNEIDFIYIRKTETGRVKTVSSTRKVPLHSELLRLGFVHYVEAMRLAGETLLFPEMYPAEGTKRSIGDVFYKIWWMNIRPFVPDLKRGQAMHAARHTVSDALKQAGVALEERNDVLGHSQTELGEGASTYSEPVILKRMQTMVEKIPNVTEHLNDVTKITLLPAEQRAARPSRRK